MNKKFAIIGKGFIYQSHEKAIKEIGGEIVDVSDGPEESLSWKDMVKNTKADCIIVLTPNYLHFEMIKFSLENNKKVLCEKPLVINSTDASSFVGRSDVFACLQLRYHPVAKRLKEEINHDKKYDIEMNISVYRDPEYYTMWKGKKEKSGGVLFNLGIHYFDMLLYLFGEAEEAKASYLDEKTGEGTILGKNYNCKWRVSTDEAKDSQRRIFKINGISYNFSSKDNLSFENLHRYIYEDLLRGKGVVSEECLKSIKLVEKLYHLYEK
jgi:UDP-N-acetyl-2-amino-2-deoxyglucuronate dehydrogenase